jgi:hypothetical protein
MYAYWYADGAIEGKKYTESTSSWGSLESIGTTDAWDEQKVPVAVANSSADVHLVYSDVNGDIIYRMRTDSTGLWNSPTTLDATDGNFYATITLETSTEDLYAFWMASDYQIKGQKYSGSWTSISYIDVNTFTKDYLTSPYDISSASLMSWAWAQGGSVPYEAKIAFIPEFGEVLAPVGFVILVSVIFSIRGRSRRNPRTVRFREMAGQEEHVQSIAEDSPQKRGS